MNTILLGLLKNLFPEEGRYIVQFGTFSDETGKSINIQIADVHGGQPGKLIANIDLSFPK